MAGRWIEGVYTIIVNSDHVLRIYKDSRISKFGSIVARMTDDRDIEIVKLTEGATDEDITKLMRELYMYLNKWDEDR